MLQKHRTAEGKTMLIAEMEDRHLINTINLFLDTIAQVKERAKNQGDALTDAMYGLKTISPEEGGKLIRDALERMYPYLAEAYLRGLPEPRMKLIELLGRAGMVDLHSNFAGAMRIPRLKTTVGIIDPIETDLLPDDWFEDD